MSDRGDSTQKGQTPPTAGGASAPPRGWREVWQLPAIVLAGAVLVGGAIYAVATRPTPDVMVDFRAAESLMQEHSYDGALALLNERVLPVLNKGGLSAEQVQGFHLMRARALSLGQREAGISRAENHAGVLAEYERAEKLGATLEPADEELLGESLVAMGELERAAERALHLPDDLRPQRIGLMQSVIERSLQRPDKRDLALQLLTTLSADPALTGEERLWALSRQARLLVMLGDADEAITRILRTLPRAMDSAPVTLRAEVLTILAEAYMAQGNDVQAAAQLRTALEVAGDRSPQSPRIRTMLGRVDQSGERLEAAREQFLMVVQNEERSDSFPDALLGLAEVETALLQQEGGGGAPEQGIQYYEQLVDMALEPGREPAIDRTPIIASLMARFREQFDRADYRTALRFATLAEGLESSEARSGDVALALALARRKLAEELLASDAGGLRRLSEVDVTTQGEARALLIASAQDYLRHAESVASTDTDAYADSLWHAGDSFDRAGDTEEAIRVLAQFAGDFPKDPRQPEAKFRLGEAYRARGDAVLAEQVYRDLLNSAGPYADASYLPLAQVLLSDDNADNDAQAERLLREILTGRLGEAGTPRYLVALRQLADLLSRDGRHDEAIEKYEEFLARVEGQTGEAVFRDRALVGYHLADAYRLSARAVEVSLRSALPDGEARRLRETRLAHLSRAGTLYELVTTDLDRVGDQSTALEELIRRNATFYRGDVAFDLGDWDAAIRLYEAAQERYPRDPASLVALTQVVAALLEMNEPQRAVIANQRAKQFYESLPESVWDDPNLPMGRREWERWLQSQSRLTSFASSGTEDEPGGG